MRPGVGVVAIEGEGGGKVARFFFVKNLLGINDSPAFGVKRDGHSFEFRLKQGDVVMNDVVTTEVAALEDGGDPGRGLAERRAVLDVGVLDSVNRGSLGGDGSLGIEPEGVRFRGMVRHDFNDRQFDDPVGTEIDAGGLDVEKGDGFVCGDFQGGRIKA